MVETGTARFSRHVAWTLGARLLIAGGSMLTGIIVARWLGAVSFGTLASLNVITVLALSFGGFGLTSAATYLVARDRNKLKAILTAALSFAFCFGIIIALLIVGLARLKPELFGKIPTELITIVVFALPFQLLTQFSVSVFLGLGSIGRYNLFDMLSQAVLLLSPLIALVLLGMQLYELVFLNTISTIILSLVVLYVMYRTANDDAANERFRFDTSLMREMFRYGMKFYVAMVSSIIVFRADLLIVNYFRSGTEAGVYAVATQIGTLLLLIPNVISAVFFPRVTEAQDVSGEMTCRVTRHATFIMLIVCLAVIPAAFLLPILYGSAFAEVPFQVMILLPGVYLLGIEIVQVQYFSSLGLPKTIPLYWVVTMLIFVTLDLIFVPMFGAYAAAVVSTVCYSLMFFMVAFFFLNKTGRSFSEAFVLRRDEFGSLLKLHRQVMPTTDSQ